MKISIIGAGNVATVLGRLLKHKNFIIEEIVSRNKMHAEKLAEELNADAIVNIQSLSSNSDVYVIAVNDDAVETVSNQLRLDEKIVVHTCGSASITVLKNTSNNFGVLYPLQSLRKEIPYLPAIPFLIDANNDYSKGIISELAKSLSDNITEANDEQRMQYHLSAVITSNFTNHLLSLTDEYCTINNIRFSQLLPLMQEVINRIQMFHPAQMQTGPAVRNDVSTIKKHLALLKDFPQLKNIYEIMSESISRFTIDDSRQGNK
jgi:predicted short-subunit dehydrogenase-like oxidoreductase (DUF2520 family)